MRHTERKRKQQMVMGIIIQRYVEIGIRKRQRKEKKSFCYPGIDKANQSPSWLPLYNHNLIYKASIFVCNETPGARNSLHKLIYRKFLIIKNKSIIY
jgi:hypothetical protein